MHLEIWRKAKTASFDDNGMIDDSHPEYITVSLRTSRMTVRRDTFEPVLGPTDPKLARDMWKALATYLWRLRDDPAT